MCRVGCNSCCSDMEMSGECALKQVVSYRIVAVLVVCLCMLLPCSFISTGWLLYINADTVSLFPCDAFKVFISLGTAVFAANFSKFCGPVCQIPWLTVANFLHIVINFLWPLNWQNMQYLSPVTANDRYSLSTKLTGNISDKPSSVFSVFLQSRARVAVMYFMVKSCTHTVQRPELHRNMPYLSPISPASTELHKIPWKCRNSMEMRKFCGSAQDSVFCGKLWSLRIMVCLLLFFFLSSFR